MTLLTGKVGDMKLTHWQMHFLHSDNELNFFFSYRWTDLGTRLDGGSEGWKGYVLNFTSQQWLNYNLVSR